MNIRPVSDLRNKYPEIEELVLKEDQAVYLTKNGYGSMVVMSLDKYESMLNEIDMERALELKFGNVNIDKLLDETEKELEDPNTKYLTHVEIFSKLRRIINSEE